MKKKIIIGLIFVVSLVVFTDMNNSPYSKEQILNSAKSYIVTNRLQPKNKKCSERLNDKEYKYACCYLPVKVLIRETYLKKSRSLKNKNDYILVAFDLPDIHDLRLGYSDKMRLSKLLFQFIEFTRNNIPLLFTQSYHPLSFRVK